MKNTRPNNSFSKPFTAALSMAGLILSFAILPARSADFTVVNNGFSSYTVNGQSNPGLTLQRGKTYTFAVSATGHPFWIKTVQGSGTLNGYSPTVSNGIDNGTVTLTLPANAPNTLFYNCQFHAAMTGVITIVDPPTPPPPLILKLNVGTNLSFKFTGSNSFSYFPEFNTNLATTNWFALTVQTNAYANGTNDVICGRPPGNNVFIRVRAQ